MKGMLEPVFEEKVLGHAKYVRHSRLPESEQLQDLMSLTVHLNVTARQESFVTAL